MDNIKYDYSKLFGLLREKNITQYDLANSIGISETSVNKKLKNKSEFKQSEMLSIVKALNYSVEDISSLFFTH